MPRHRNRLLLAVLIALFARGTVLAESKAEKIDQLLSLYHAYGHLNGAVLVAEGGEVVYQKAFGTANFEWQIPAAVDTRFRVYSIAKQLTSMLVMQLVAEDKVKLDGKLADYLPYYRKDTGARITIHNLLTHTHGITPPEAGAIPRSSRFSFAELIRTHYSNELEFEPGTSFRYGIGHIILAAIIEEVTGKSFEAVLKERILDPLGMKDTGYVHNEKVIEKLAGPYREADDGLERRLERDLSQSIGASGMYSTLADLFSWDQGLRQDKLVSRQYQTLMYQPHNPDWARPYGYGWNVHRYREGDVEKTLVSHDGGGVAFIYRAVEDNATVIILGNVRRIEYKLSEISARVMQILQGTPYSLPKRSIVRPLLKAFAESGAEAMVAQYRELAASQDQDHDFSERALNSLGYRLLGMGEPLAAIEVFKLNVERYPESANVYDSLAEAYMTNDDRKPAIENYQRSLDLDPGNTHAVQMLRELRETEEAGLDTSPGGESRRPFP